MEEVGVCQVKWNSGEFVPNLERFRSRLVMGGACVNSQGTGSSGSILVCFGWEHVFLEILLRFVFGGESANVGLTPGSPTN